MGTFLVFHILHPFRWESAPSECGDQHTSAHGQLHVSTSDDLLPGATGCIFRTTTTRAAAATRHMSPEASHRHLDESSGRQGPTSHYMLFGAFTGRRIMFIKIIFLLRKRRWAQSIMLRRKKGGE